jgi:ABC-type sugar transport system ATPase subunit
MVNVSLVQVSFFNKNFKKENVIDSMFAASGISLDINSGEFLALVGPVNNGKSHLLRIIAGLTEPYSGMVLFNGKPLGEYSPDYRKMAMVFQSQALYPHLTVRENLEFGLKMVNLSKETINARIAEVTDLLNLSSILNTKPGYLSGSQKQLAAIARAFVKRPQILIFDEPISELDSQLKIKIQSIIRRFCINLQATVIYATHNPSEAMTLGDRIVYIENGKIQQIGTSNEFYDKPVNETVARFISYPEMNFLEFETGEENDLPVLNLINTASCSIPIPQVFEKIIESHPKAKIGIRAENLKIVPEKPNAIPMVVEMQEYVGSQSFLHVSNKNQTLAVEVPLNEDYDLGKTVHIELTENKIHLFADGNFVI